MTYTVIVFHANGEICRSTQPKAPNYDQQKNAVGGYIETVPHFTKYDGMTRGTCYANEDGIGKFLPFNKNATDAWLACLGKGPFAYKPRLYGDVIFYARSK